MHSAESDAGVILTLTEARLLEPKGDALDRASVALRQAFSGQAPRAALSSTGPTSGWLHSGTTTEAGFQVRPSKNSFILAKKPALSGWVVFDDSEANSVKSSR